MWYLEKLTGRGGLLGSTLSSTFEGHQFPTEEDLFVRETIQNSKDNPAGKAKPRILFRLVTLRDKKKDSFLKLLKLRDLYANKNLLVRAPPFSELKNLGSDGPLGLLYIEDFNTTGLDGCIDDPTGNWMRFNLHGDPAKLEEHGKIGSYGYGKSVLSRAAGTNTFIVYTAVRPTKGDPSTARLMGHTFQPWFRADVGQKTGRGWLCKSVNQDGDPTPFTDSEADELAEMAGFTPRRKDQTGTSFLLIGTHPAKTPLKIENIRRALETWWWPALIDNELDVELWENNKRLDGATPRLREDLKPFIACKARLDTGVGDDVYEPTFYREHGRALGRLALTLASDESIFDSPLHPKYPGPRRVARMRAEAGMITEYKEFGTARRLSFVGFYSGSMDVDDALKFSEPATHDEWSSVSQRLARTKHGSDLVKAIEERTNSACLAFQRKNSASRAPLTERLPELERLLGAAFDERDDVSTRKRKRKKKPQYRATVVDFPGNLDGKLIPIYGKDRNKLDFLIRYRLRQDIAKQTKISAWLDLSVVLDAEHKKGEPLQVEVTDQATRRVVYRGDDARFPVDLAPGKSKTFRVTSSAYPRHQVVVFDEGETATTGAS